jgi:hypothetical protein
MTKKKKQDDDVVDVTEVADAAEARANEIAEVEAALLDSEPATAIDGDVAPYEADEVVVEVNDLQRQKDQMKASGYLV